MRPRALVCKAASVISLVTTASAAALAACGSTSPGDSGSAHAGESARAAALLAQTFGPNPSSDSGVIDGTITITIKGIKRFSQPLALTTSGPFSDSAGSDLPNSDQAVGLDNYGAGLTTSAGKVWLDIGTAAYPIPAPITALMSQAASSAHNGLMRTVGSFDIRPDLWIRNPQIVGNTTLAGVNVVHLTADIDPTSMFLDASRFTRFLTRLQITQLAGLPQSIGPAAQAALVRSVTSAHGNLYTGSADHVLRRADLTLSLAVAPVDRKLLGGITSATVTANLGVTQVGQPQQIHVLPDQHPYSQAKVLLQFAAYSHRTPAERGQ